MNGDFCISLNTFGEVVSGAKEVAQSWFVILNTIPGSDPLRPTFGSDIFEYADNPNNGFGGDFSAVIIRDLQKWEPRTTISQVKAVAGDDDNIAVSISGIYTATNAKIEATFSLSTLSTADNVAKMKAYSADYNEKQYS